jgi:hypothetical protein
MGSILKDRNKRRYFPTEQRSLMILGTTHGVSQETIYMYSGSHRKLGPYEGTECGSLIRAVN